MALFKLIIKFSMSIMSVGSFGYGFPVGYGRRIGIYGDVVHLFQALQYGAQMEFSQPPQHGLIDRGVPFDLNAGVLLGHFVHGFGEFLFLPPFVWRYGESGQRHGKADRLQAQVVLFVHIVQHGVEMNIRYFLNHYKIATTQIKLQLQI